MREPAGRAAEGGWSSSSGVTGTARRQMPANYARSRSDADRARRRNSPCPTSVCPHVHDEHASLTGTSRLLGSYWLEVPARPSQKPCCSFTPPARPRVNEPRVNALRLARAALTVAAYALIVAALAVALAAGG